MRGIGLPVEDASKAACCVCECSLPGISKSERERAGVMIRKCVEVTIKIRFGRQAQGNDSVIRYVQISSCSDRS